jgi:hypothetical protein
MNRPLTCFLSSLPWSSTTPPRAPTHTSLFSVWQPECRQSVISRLHHVPWVLSLHQLPILLDENPALTDPGWCSLPSLISSLATLWRTHFFLAPLTPFLVYKHICGINVFVSAVLPAWSALPSLWTYNHFLWVHHLLIREDLTHHLL